jgi:hypothetical protein
MGGDGLGGGGEGGGAGGVGGVGGVGGGAVPPSTPTERVLCAATRFGLNVLFSMTNRTSCALLVPSDGRWRRLSDAQKARGPQTSVPTRTSIIRSWSARAGGGAPSCGCGRCVALHHNATVRCHSSPPHKRLTHLVPRGSPCTAPSRRWSSSQPSRGRGSPWSGSRAWVGACWARGRSR